MMPCGASSPSPSVEFLRRTCARAFTLVELLVVVAILALLMAIVLPSLARAREQALQVKCLSNLRQFGQAMHMYAHEFKAHALPLAYTRPEIIGNGPAIFWWGTDDAGAVDHTRGFIWPYLHSDLRSVGLFECPLQPWGTYEAQGQAQAVTSTYGYNGYFLSPPHATSWSWSIGHRPWQKLDTLRRPDVLFAFGDALVRLGDEVRNTALLDPPLLFQGNHRWARNTSPTSAFRHGGRTAVAFVDGHAAAVGLGNGKLTSTEPPIGAAGAENDPHYVPDWRDW